MGGSIVLREYIFWCNQAIAIILCYNNALSKMGCGYKVISVFSIFMLQEMHVSTVAFIVMELE